MTPGYYWVRFSPNDEPEPAHIAKDRHLDGHHAVSICGNPTEFVLTELQVLGPCIPPASGTQYDTRDPAPGQLATLRAIAQGANTTRTIANACGLGSIQAAQGRVRRCVSKGWVERCGRSTETHRVGLGVYAGRARSLSVIYRLTEEGREQLT